MDRILKKQVSSSISDDSERRKVENIYALKSIQLDRVKPLYVEELKNEIAILKSTDHPNIVKAHEVRRTTSAVPRLMRQQEIR